MIDSGGTQLADSPANQSRPTGRTKPASRTRPTDLAETDRTRLRRASEKGSFDRDELTALLRAGLICHLGVIVDGYPMVVPTVYGLDDRAETLYLHGSVASRSLIESPHATICVTVTHVDGLVLARSVFEQAVNYRSAMIYGVPRLVIDDDQKLAGLRLLTEHLTPGQWDYVRQPSRKELAATSLLALAIDEASVKTRSGPPDDGDSPDAALGLWAGVIPTQPVWGAPIPDTADIAAPPHITALTRRDAR